MSNRMILKTIETLTMKASLSSDDIVRVMLKKNSEIDSDATLKNIKAYIELTNNNKYAFIIFAEDSSVVYTEDARKNAKINEQLFEKVCIAVIVKTLAHRLITNFYFKFYKPGYPFKVFTNVNEAEDWCLKECTKIQKADLV